MSRHAAPNFPWRSWDEMPGEDLVMMPRALALDLVKALSITTFSNDATAEELQADLHTERYSAHQERLERVMNTITAHLVDEGLSPTADLLLRSVVIAYEIAPEIGVKA